MIFRKLGGFREYFRKPYRDCYNHSMHWRALVVLSYFTSVILSGVAYAAAPVISRAYQISSSTPAGSLVSLTANPGVAESANTANADKLIGVTVASNQSLIAIDQTSASTQVATNGTVMALVSTLKGDISSGDRVAVSALSGVGAKAQPGDQIIGFAKLSLSGSTPDTTSQTIIDTNGRKHIVAIGTIPINIAISTFASGNNDANLTGLQKLVKSLTGHVLPTARILLAIIITIVALFTLAALTYSSIYGGIISLGRNPLARYVILKSLVGVIIAATLIAIVANTTVFFLLR